MIDEPLRAKLVKQLDLALAPGFSSNRRRAVLMFSMLTGVPPRLGCFDCHDHSLFGFSLRKGPGSGSMWAGRRCLCSDCGIEDLSAPYTGVSDARRFTMSRPVFHRGPQGPRPSSRTCARRLRPGAWSRRPGIGSLPLCFGEPALLRSVSPDPREERPKGSPMSKAGTAPGRQAARARCRKASSGGHEKATGDDARRLPCA